MGYVFESLAGKKYFDDELKVTSAEASEPLPKDRLGEVLAMFKDRKYFRAFRDRNIAVTKRDIKDAVGDDNLIIQVINCIDELSKAANMLVKRLREWYELYNPEFSKSIASNEKFSELVIRKGKKDLLKELGIEVSMGADLNKEDVEEIRLLASGVLGLYKLRDEQEDYLKKLMKRQKII